MTMRNLHIRFAQLPVDSWVRTPRTLWQLNCIFLCSAPNKLLRSGSDIEMTEGTTHVTASASSMPLRGLRSILSNKYGDTWGQPHVLHCWVALRVTHRPVIPAQETVQGGGEAMGAARCHLQAFSAESWGWQHTLIPLYVLPGVCLIGHLANYPSAGLTCHTHCWWCP